MGTGRALEVGIAGSSGQGVACSNPVVVEEDTEAANRGVAWAGQAANRGVAWAGQTARRGVAWAGQAARRGVDHPAAVMAVAWVGLPAVYTSGAGQVGAWVEAQLAATQSTGTGAEVVPSLKKALELVPSLRMLVVDNPGLCSAAEPG